MEEYCKLLYGVHEKLAGGKEAAADKVYISVKQKLVKIFNSFQHDVRIRLEAVFLPYKASMWDSLETEYYEANEYPDNVPITRYDEFDFELHRPDMIFIHNPYDSYNFVTSVHPFFIRSITSSLRNV